MKVVLFCGGLGLRLYPLTDSTPKPMVPIGGKPLLWHVMKYYSYFGHVDFVLCLGYKGEEIKRYFLDQDGCFSNDFTLSNNYKKRDLLNSDTANWTITFVDTGLHSNVGQRLKAVQKYVEGEDMFLANYSDAVTDLKLPALIDFFMRSGKTGCLTTVKPLLAYHTVSANAKGCVKSVLPISQSGTRINGGYFAFKKEIFDYIKNGEDLVNEPFRRLIKKQELVAYDYDGFWMTMDTFKDKQRLDDLASSDKACWELWEN
ncbi:MAG: sugar phosphate nucleotidyltransferase [Candidatus Bathyarchaeia archaeon]